MDAPTKRGQKVRVAYLVNQYPAISHTFIRREISAVERSGLVDVVRYSLDHHPNDVVDEADRREAEVTRVILKLGLSKLMLSTLSLAVKSPVRMVRALSLAVKVGWRSDRGLLRHFAYLAEACALESMTREDKVDHVHAHFGTNATAVAMLCHELGGPTYSFTMHGPLEFERAPLLDLPAKISRAKFVAAITEFCRAQTWRNSAPEDHKKVHVVTCGVDASFLNVDPQPIPSEGKLVFVGRLTKLKAPDLLIEALARLDAEGHDFELTIAGDGDLRPDIEARITRFGLSEKIRIAGYCDERAVREFIQSSRALVLPSFSEGLPVVLMEAFALGRPVVSTYIAGIPELVVPEKSGWLVPAGSIDGLTEALRQVLKAPPERLECMGRVGRARALERHDVDKSGRALAQLFVEARSS